MFYEGCTLEEIIAYRKLENETFDFGEGPMKMEGLLGSEDAYYEMDIQSHKDKRHDDYLDYLGRLENRKLRKLKNQGEPRINRKNKLRDKLRNERLKEIGDWWIISNMETHLIRRYRGKCSMYIKKKSNKKVRTSKNLASRGGYRKAYDFWWELW